MLRLCSATTLCNRAQGDVFLIYGVLEYWIFSASVFRIFGLEPLTFNPIPSPFRRKGRLIELRIAFDNK
jgi:hypothetical protein